MPSSETPQFPPAYECPGCPEVCQNGTLMATGRVWWGYGGGTEGERWGKGGGEKALQCAILAHNPLLVPNVNQQSIPRKAPFARHPKKRSRINAKAQRGKVATKSSSASSSSS